MLNRILNKFFTKKERDLKTYYRKEKNAVITRDEDNRITLDKVKYSTDRDFYMHELMCSIILSVDN